MGVVAARLLCLALALALASAACAGAAPASADGATSRAPVEPTSATTVATTTVPPSFLTMPLIDVRTGERFTLASFPGKVTIVEGMAVW